VKGGIGVEVGCWAREGWDKRRSRVGRRRVGGCMVFVCCALVGSLSRGKGAGERG
jgi:hypothetical protein